MSSTSSLRMLEIDGPIPASDDYTFFIDPATHKKFVTDHYRLLNVAAPAEDKIPASHEVELRVNGTGHASGDYVAGRALICRCHKRRYASVTLRVQGRSRKSPPEPRPTPDHEAFQGSPFKPSSNRKARCCLTAADLCDVLSKAVFGPDDGPSPQGLILVTGRTGSMKSTIARGLIHRHLGRELARNRERVPHVVTHEDPIEQEFYAESHRDKGPALPIDYTPRDRNAGDTSGLEETLNNALRQTPSAVYVGELRDPKDWHHVQRFAGTGHLAVATAHAGSLTETLQRMFAFAKADTPARRGQVAESLCAVIHQSAVTLHGDAAGDFNVVVPTFWRHTRSGVATLVADGLGAIVPGRPPRGREAEYSTFGKSWFADQTAGLLAPPEISDHAQLQSLARRYRAECLRLDLEAI